MSGFLNKFTRSFLAEFSKRTRFSRKTPSNKMKDPHERKFEWKTPEIFPLANSFFHTHVRLLFNPIMFEQN